MGYETCVSSALSEGGIFLRAGPALDASANLRQMLDGVAENAQALAFFGQSSCAGEAGRPCRMLGRVDVALRVRHEAENEAGGVANPGDVVDAAVGVFTFVDEGDLFFGPERGAHVLTDGDELAFAVGDGQLN